MTTEVLTYVIGAGATVRAPRGRLFFVKSAANPISITASGRPGAPIKFSNITAGLKYGPVDESEHWEYLEITSATAQTVEIIIGDDDVEVAGTVSVAGTVTTQDATNTISNFGSDISIAATSSGFIAANASRKGVFLCSNSANVGSVRMGDGSASATAGLELQPGQTLFVPTAAVIWFYNPNASTVTINGTQLV